MEANNLTAIQIATAEKMFNKEHGRHAEMPCELSINGNQIFFIGNLVERPSAKCIHANTPFTPTVTR